MGLETAQFTLKSDGVDRPRPVLAPSLPTALHSSLPVRRSRPPSRRPPATIKTLWPQSTPRPPPSAAAARRLVGGARRTTPRRAGRMAPLPAAAPPPSPPSTAAAATGAGGSAAGADAAVAAADAPPYFTPQFGT